MVLVSMSTREHELGQWIASGGELRVRAAGRVGAALERAKREGGGIAAAAALLGLPRRTLYRYIRELGLNDAKRSKAAAALRRAQ